MKILHVEGGRNLYGGPHQVLLLMEGLKARGIENHLACRPGCQLAERAVAVATVHPVPMRGDLDVSLIARLYRLIQNVKPDIVHLHSRIGADVMGGLAARLGGTPVIHSRRNDNPESRWMVALKYRLHDRVIAISEGIGRVLLSEGLPAAKLRYARDAVDAEEWQEPRDRDWFAQAFGIGPAQPVIGVVAQLIPRKGHRYLIEAVARIVGDHPDLQALFFGQGPQEVELIQAIQDRGLECTIRLAGFRPDLPRILPCLDVLVHPALMEGMGVSLLQGACAAVPIIASRVGGIPEAVSAGETGILVAPADPLELAGALARLLEDPGLRRCMGMAGRQRVMREFSPQVMVEANLAVYREVLRGGGA